MRLFVRYLFLTLLVTTGCQQSYAQHKANRHHKKHIKKDKYIYRGTASYYSDEFIGKKTASGEKFNQNKLTAACNLLPLGTFVIVTNLTNGKKVKVKINDRLNRSTKRLIDLTKLGARKLAFLDKGLAQVKIEVQKNN